MRKEAGWGRVGGLRCALLAALVAWVGGALSGCVYAPFDLGLDRIGEVYEATVVDARGDGKLLLLRVDGEISDHPSNGGLLGARPATTAQIRRDLDRARKDDDIRGVIVRINSPGGGVTASDLIYRELLSFKREKKVPIVAFLLDTAASGGYYIAQAADRIVAVPTSIVGSIGVIAQFPDVQGLGEKVGVKMVTLTTGRRKDVGNPFRHMTAEEKAFVQRLLDAMHRRFVGVVATGRRPGAGRKGIAKAALERLADGRVFTAQEAKRLGLLDRIGYFEDAYAIAETLSATESPRVVTYQRREIGQGRPTIYSVEAEGTAIQVRGADSPLEATLMPVLGAVTGRLRGGARFQYLWLPGSF